MARLHGPQSSALTHLPHDTGIPLVLLVPMPGYWQQRGSWSTVTALGSPNLSGSLHAAHRSACCIRKAVYCSIVIRWL